MFIHCLTKQGLFGDTHVQVKYAFPPKSLLVFLHKLCVDFLILSKTKRADLTAVAAHINNRGEEARHCRREKPVGLRRTAGINMRSFIIIPLFLGCPVIFQ